MVLATTGPRRIRGASTIDDDAFEDDARHNVAQPERIGSVAVGAALLGYGARRRDAVGLAAALFG